MRVLITGVTGFIGHHLILKLTKVKEIKEILCLVRNETLARRKFLNIKKINFKEIDLIRDKIKINKKYDVLIHLGELIPTLNQKNRITFIENNLIAKNIIENILFTERVNKIIYTSTVDVYGKPLYLPIDEEHPKNPLTLYGISKYTNELYLKKVCEQMNIKLIILRLSQVYGPDEPVIKVIPLFVKKIKQNKTITLYDRGKVVRDWVYVEDVVSAIIKALYFNNDTEVFNIGSGKQNTLLDLIRILKKLFNSNVKIEISNIKKDSRPKLFFNINKAQNKLKYKPKFDLEKGVTEYLKYEKHNF